MSHKRIIGRYTGEEKGPLLIVFGQMHGNEPAGTKAIDLMLKMLEVEPITNPEFVYRGRMLGLIGNRKAAKKGIRFIEKDLNRCWTQKNIDRILGKNKNELKPEEQEIKELINIIKKEVEEYNPDKVYVLDLHTTSSNGGIFTIVPDLPESIRIAMELNAPVVLGMLEGVKGTSTEYFDEKALGVPTVSLTFESGNHHDILSVNRAIAAMTNLMGIIGHIDPRHVENRHNVLLNEYSKNLPKLSKLVYKHSIGSTDGFIMKKGYKNFQPIIKGELLASDSKGKILSPANGRILMPLYQTQGEDGFFIIKEIDKTLSQNER